MTPFCHAPPDSPLMAIVSDLSGPAGYESAMKHALPLVGLVLALALPARADDDHDRARDALAAGEILSLGVILDQIADVAPGVPIEIELERDDGLWVYSLEIRAPNGRLVEVEVDATTGAILEIEEEDD